MHALVYVCVCCKEFQGEVFMTCYPFWVAGMWGVCVWRRYCECGGASTGMVSWVGGMDRTVC